MPTVSCCNVSRSFPVQFELFKLLKVIGETTVQTIVAIDAELPHGTRGVQSVNITTADETFHVFTDKVVKQGTLVIVAVIINAEGELVTFRTTARFMATAIIPGVRPGMEVDIQFHNVLIENDLTAMNGLLTGKVHLVEFIKVSTFVQRFVSTTQSPMAAQTSQGTAQTTVVRC